MYNVYVYNILIYNLRITLFINFKFIYDFYYKLTIRLHNLKLFPNAWSRYNIGYITLNVTYVKYVCISIVCTTYCAIGGLS